MELCRMTSPSNRLTHSKEPCLACRSTRRDVGRDSETGAMVGWAGPRTAWRATEECTGIVLPAGWRSRSKISKHNLLVQEQRRPAKRRSQRPRQLDSKQCRRVSRSTVLLAQDHMTRGHHLRCLGVSAGCRMREMYKWVFGRVVRIGL